jgi:hypothetical protein
VSGFDEFFKGTVHFLFEGEFEEVEAVSFTRYISESFEEIINISFKEFHLGSLVRSETEFREIYLDIVETSESLVLNGSHGLVIINGFDHILLDDLKRFSSIVEAVQRVNELELAKGSVRILLPVNFELVL